MLSNNFRLLLILILLGFSSVIKADISIDASAQYGYTDNLLSDSTALVDVHYSTTFNTSFYPLSFIEVNASNTFMYYRDLTDLSNHYPGIRLTVIPTGAKSPFTLYVSSNFNGRLHKSKFSDFNNNIFDFTSSMNYRISETINFRSGFTYRSTHYITSDIADKDNKEFFAGVNFTLPGRNSFDFEIGYGLSGYSFIDVLGKTEFDIISDPADPLASLTDGNVKFFFLSPRFSRSLGSKTGMNITFTHRVLNETENSVVYGFSSGYLSPWASIWQGDAISLNVKSFLIPTFITNAGIGYWEKEFLNSLETQKFFFFQVEDRSDEQVRLYLSFQRPIVKYFGLFFEPTLRVDLTNNKSTNLLYDYHNFSISLSLNFHP